MLKRDTPKTRAWLNKPRKPLARKGKRAKAVDSAIAKAKDFYFGDQDKKPCQFCAKDMWRCNCAGHHKIKRSLKRDDSMENLVIIHHGCHRQIHTENAEGQALLKKVRDSTANARNKEMIQ